MPVAMTKAGNMRKLPPMPKKPDSAPTAKTNEFREVFTRQPDQGFYRDTLAPNHEDSHHHHEHGEKSEQSLAVDRLARAHYGLKSVREPGPSQFATSSDCLQSQDEDP